MSKHSVACIESVIDYVETHLLIKLDLNHLADTVHYSKYHLHRLFKDTTGLTIHEYILRRRLTEAAGLLIFTKKPILDVAIMAGYESQQAFTNVFTAMYKLPPNQYREKGQFYPLQFRLELSGAFTMLDRKSKPQWEVQFASDTDIPMWMDLVRLVIDGFPNLQEDAYLKILKSKIKKNQALLIKIGERAIGIMLFSPMNSSIDFMGIHPLYQKKAIPQAFFNKIRNEFLIGIDNKISITTYRKGDRADTGHRKKLLALGFLEGDLLVEFDYPTQRFVLLGEDIKHE